MIDISDFNRGKSIEVTESGVFSRRSMWLNQNIGPAFLDNGKTYDQSFLVGYLRHNDDPNLELSETSPRKFVFLTRKAVAKGEELTIDRSTYPWPQE